MLDGSVSAGTIAPPPPGRRSRAQRRSRGADDLALPPDDIGRGGGGNGGDGGDSSRGRGAGRGDGGADRARLGLFLAILSMSSLFAAFLIAYLLLRKNAAVWPPPGAPLPPKGLWMSTLVILASSATFVRAVRAGRAKSARDLFRWLVATLALGVAFLVVQFLLWRAVLAGGRFAFSDAYGTIFYSLTGLHAAHVIVGLAFLARTTLRARRDPRSPRTLSSLGLCSTYWHFMGAVWIVLFTVLTFLS